MQNKNLCTKIGFLGLILMCVCLPMRVLGIQVKLDVSRLDKVDRYDEAKAGDNLQRYNHVHFVDNGNDFGGILYISSESNITEGVGKVEIGDMDPYVCAIQYQGVYYNSERGERLWPLDYDTRNKFFRPDITSFTGGLYLGCRSEIFDKNCSAEEIEDPDCYKHVDHQGIYGMVSYKYKDQEFSLVSGVEYKTGDNWIEIDPDSKFAPTLDLFNSKQLLGFIYDTNGGIGFVGCEFTGENKGNSLKTLVNVVMAKNQEFKHRENYNNSDHLFQGNFFVLGEDTYPVLVGTLSNVNLDCANIGVGSDKTLRILVEGLVGVGAGSKSSYSDLVNANKGSKMQIFSTVQLNNSALINYAKKKAELLCRGRWDGTDHGNGVVCFDKPGSPIDATNSSYKNKTLIIKNGDVKVKPGDDVYDIFIDKGMLYIMSDDDNSNLKLFDKNGAVITEDIADFNNKVAENGIGYTGTGVSVGKLLKGNFVVNGLIGNANSSTNPLRDKYFIHGKFTSLNTVEAPLLKEREYLVKNAGKDDPNILVSFGELFKWTCTELSGSDNNACPHIGDYWMAPIAVIERNFPSALLK